jgi:hypothetical protein
MGTAVSQRASFEFEIETFRKDLLDLAEQAPLIMARALNRAAVSGQAAMVKVVASDTGLLAKYVKREIVIDKASRARPMVALTIAGRRIPLIAFQARGREPSRGLGQGVSYRLLGGRGRVADAFIATVGIGGHRGVFKRRGTSRRKSVGAWSRNLPIVELRGPSVPHVFEKHLDKFRAAAEESFLKNLASEIGFEKAKNQPASEPA